MSEHAPASVSFRDRLAAEANTLQASRLYLNRELSWLEFNARVLAEADSEAVPLGERLKFHAIVASNLDEFFMVRVAGLKQQLAGGVAEESPDGLSVNDQLTAIGDRVHELARLQFEALHERLLPRLAEHGLLILKPGQLPPELLAEIDDVFARDIFPILTPIAIDPGHPFPHVRNKSLNLGVMFTREGATESGFGVVQVPMMLPRLMPVTGVRLANGQRAKHAFVLLEDVIARHVGTCFPGARFKGVYSFRVTRNFDLSIDDEEAQDLLQTIQQELRKRERGNAVRLEVSGDAPAASLAKLTKALKLDPERDVYVSRGMLNVNDLMRVKAFDERRELRDEPFTPHVAKPFRDADDLFAIVRERDVMLHHQYDSYESVVDFISAAADDPDVLAIKQTLYRTGGDSPFVKALARAAEAGKQVTAIVELKARFDEESNIAWARTLEQSGVHVVYGLIGLKTHAKCTLIVRREKGRLRRYAHLATGNYNPQTARLYTDLSFFTSRPELGEDVSSLFNLLTGYSAPPKWNSLVVAPVAMHERILELIDRERGHAHAGRPSGIVAKMNALVDADVIEALYRASQAGVPIRLLVRGICCLRPGVPGVSESIEVRAILDRFLEHSRVMRFTNGGDEEFYFASADWMPRNFHRRVEILCPIADQSLRDRITEILDLQLADNTKAWVLRADGSYDRVNDTGTALRSQQKFIELARAASRSGELGAISSRRFQVGPMRPPPSRSSLHPPAPKTRKKHGH